ncbi:MAG: ABC transporter ATP-binding protein [Ruminococcus sp.]|jgi:ABC-2 type transport system ATP-binding protein|nr:ABC transporter ATP-binding protein [Ruminococcus sp.]
MSEDVLSIKNLSKVIKNNTILDNLSLTIHKNSIYGVVGVNGSGKSTLLRILAGLTSFESGEIKYFGNGVFPHTAYISDFPGLYDLMTAHEFLQYIVDLRKEKADSEVIKSAIITVGLKDNKKHIKNYSRGMKQRLAIAETLVTNPELILFDEPIAGIDFAGREMFVSVINELKNKSTIIIASHDLRELGKMCDRAVIIDKGKKIVEDEIASLGKIFGGVVINITIERPLEAEEINAVMGLHPDINSVNSVGRTFSIMLSKLSNQILQSVINYFCEKQISIENISVSDAKLEDIFTGEVADL